VFARGDFADWIRAMPHKQLDFFPRGIQSSALSKFLEKDAFQSCCASSFH
jgi:hypothetical protein